MAAFFIQRPVFASVIAILTILLGAIVLTSLPITEYPQIAPPTVQITSTYRGANAQAVQDSVATPIESQVNGVDHMLYMKSVNANDGGMTLQVTFELGTSIDIDQVNTQNRVSLAEPQLPESVRRQGINVDKTSPDILMVLSLLSPQGTYDSIFLSNYAEINIINSLARIPGIGQVTNFTAQDYSMRLWLNPDRMASLGITPQEVIQAVQDQNVQAAAGQIGAPPVPPGQQHQWTIVAEGLLKTPQQFGEIIIRSNPDGSQVKLTDIAQVELGAQTYASLTRVNGKPGAVMGLFLLPGANALEVAKEVKKFMSEAKNRFPSDLDYAITLDTTRPITASIDEILHTLVEAIFLVVFVIFLFLQSGRATLIPLLTVPVSLVGTFLLFPIIGFSVNTLSLFGLVLAIGIVVDDAIVVVEAVQHHIEQGMSARDATFKAMKEVSGPVVATSLILCAVFVPVAFLGGMTGELYKQFALTITISVLFSTVNALTLSPALSALLLRPASQSHNFLQKIFDGFNRGFDAFLQRYSASVKYLLSNSLKGMMVLALCLASLFLLLRKTPGGFIPDEDKGYFFINVLLPNGASLERTDQVCRKVEAILQETPGVEWYTTVGGTSLLSNTKSSYVASFFVSLQDWKKRNDAATSLTGITQGLRKKLGSLPDALIFPFTPPPVPGFGNAGGFVFELQDRSGGDLSQLTQATKSFLEAAKQRPELGTLFTGFRSDVPQLQVDLDREKARTLGVEVGDVYQTLQIYLGGYYINDFIRFGQVYRVYAQAQSKFRVAPEDIGRFYVRNRSGDKVPLSTLVKVTPILGPEYLTRYNLYQAVEINGGPAPGYSSSQAMAAMEEVAQQVLPRNMSYEWTGTAYEQSKASGKMGMTFALAIVFVLLLLAALYESWSLPLSVLLGTPLVVLGALLALRLGGMELNIYGQIGLVTLVGLGAKNAILIVEFAKLKREEGLSITAAALEAARLRVRPILMTSFASVLGVMPLMLSSGSGANARHSLGTTIFGGMLLGSTLGIFIIPVFYKVVQGFNERASKNKVEAT